MLGLGESEAPVEADTHVRPLAQQLEHEGVEIAREVCEEEPGALRRQCGGREQGGEILLGASQAAEDNREGHALRKGQDPAQDPTLGCPGLLLFFLTPMALSSAPCVRAVVQTAHQSNHLEASLPRVTSSSVDRSSAAATAEGSASTHRYHQHNHNHHHRHHHHHHHHHHFHHHHHHHHHP